METNTDIRSTAALITSKINAMCNAKTTEEIVANFVDAKDLLIALYKLNVEKVQK